MYDHVYTSKCSKRLEGVRGFRLTMSQCLPLVGGMITIWPEFISKFDQHSTLSVSNTKLIFVSIRFESTTDKNLDIHHVWSIEKFSDRLQLYTHFWNKIWISIFVLPWRSFKRSNNFRSVHLSNFLYIC